MPPRSAATGGELGPTLDFETRPSQSCVWSTLRTYTLGHESCIMNQIQPRVPSDATHSLFRF